MDRDPQKSETIQLLRSNLKNHDAFKESTSRKLSTTSEVGNRVIAVALQTIKSHIHRASKNSLNLCGE